MLNVGTYGKCTKMLLCAIEVAVKTTILSEYSYDSVTYEAMVMTDICCGHPPFIGVYDHPECPKPLLVLKYYSVNGKPYTFHQYLRNVHQKRELNDLARILLGI